MLAGMITAGMCDFTDEDDETALFGPHAYRNRELNHTNTSATVLQHRSKQPSSAIHPLDPAYQSSLVVVRNANTKGNAAAFLAVDTKPMPEFFAHIGRGIKPTVNEFFFVMPVIEPCRIAAPSNAGVVRIRNIPYSTPRAEITAFVGRSAKLVAQPLGSPYFAVHVLMERHTGKTMDAFIEVRNPAEAHFIVNQFSKRSREGRQPRIGDRFVEIEVSNQETLMRELFPRAKNVSWEGATPKIHVIEEFYYPGVPAAGFTGFLQPEEITMVVKHAETPHRVSVALSKSSPRLLTLCL
jgi:hypothetical protein